MRIGVIVVVTILVTLAAVAATAIVLSVTGEPKVVTVVTGNEPGDAISRTVQTIVDGSTLRLTNGDVLRLLDTDSPEPGRECYGYESKRALTKRAPRGSTIWLLNKDRAGTENRVAAYVTVDGHFLNSELMKLGAVAPYFPHGKQGVFSSTLLSQAQAARRKDQGMWGACPQAILDPAVGARTG